MKTTALLSGTLTLIAAVSLTGCSGDATDSPSTSTPAPSQTQTMGPLNSPAFAEGVATYNALFALPQTEHLPPEASKYATPIWINNADLTTRNFWTKIDGGPVSRATGSAKIAAWKPVKLYLDGPSQSPRWSMILRACVVANPTYYSASGKVIASGSSAKVATLEFDSPDKGKTWKIAFSEFDGASPKADAVTVPCEE